MPRLLVLPVVAKHLEQPRREERDAIKGPLARLEADDPEQMTSRDTAPAAELRDARFLAPVAAPTSRASVNSKPSEALKRHIGRCWRDVQVVRQHIMVCPRWIHAAGRALLGLPSESPFL